MSKESVLKALVSDVMLPASRAVESSSTTLEKAALALATEPSPSSLTACQNSWCSALLAWKRLYCFRHGPFVESGALYRSSFWPVRLQSLDATFGGSQTIDDAALDALGVDEKGLYALEAILFGTDGGRAVLSLFSGTSGARRREFLVASSRNVSGLARLGSAGLGDGQRFAASFASAGQDSLNQVVNQMVETVEATYQHLTRVLGLAESGMLRSAEVEGAPSGQSHEIARTLLAETGGLYVREGQLRISELVRAKSSTLDDHLRDALAKLHTATVNLDRPLEQLVRTDRARLESVAQTIKQLELSFKVELASTLAVTLTFTKGDGD